MMYKSPIEIAYGQLQTKFDGDVVKAVQSYNINVDKDELIKALAYDRGQYDKGYRDAMATIVRCKDCIFFKDDTEYCRKRKAGYAVIFLCFLLLFAIVLLLGAIVSIGQAIYDGWTGRKDGADNE